MNLKSTVLMERALVYILPQFSVKNIKKKNQRFLLYLQKFLFYHILSLHYTQASMYIDRIFTNDTAISSSNSLLKCISNLMDIICNRLNFKYGSCKF